mmetsp:Transcript_20990/g.58618  ORF Transcript_20990/g.58618 Transcript_20990/m.58618 type:complete len:552 (+) Transcript_20990:68-1723(+)
MASIFSMSAPRENQLLMGVLMGTVVSVSIVTEIPEVGLAIFAVAYLVLGKCSRQPKKRFDAELQKDPKSVVVDWKPMVGILFAFGISTKLVLDIPQLSFALCSLLAYFIICRRTQSQSRSKKNFAGARSDKVASNPTNKEAKVMSRASALPPGRATLAQSQEELATPPSTPALHGTPAQSPLARATPPPRDFFDGKRASLCVAAMAESGDCEVQTLLNNILPDAQDEQVVRRLVYLVQRAIRRVVPEAHVKGVACASVVRASATGLHPDVDVVVTVQQEVLAQRLGAYFNNSASKPGRPGKSLRTLQPDSLQKTATRVLSERLSSFAFWRSAFRGPEPKVVLLAPVSLGIFEEAIRMNFSVNTPYPLRSAIVFDKGSLRMKELTCLVRRWAHDRCISNVAKGHLHPYAWSLLVVYFLRCGTGSGKSSEKQVIEVFAEFVRFYGELFDCNESPISITFSAEAENRPCSPWSVLLGTPNIEDPFAHGTNVADSMTAEAFTRLKEEFSRADRLCSKGARVTELLQRWSPLQMPEKMQDTRADSSMTTSTGSDSE